MPVRRYREGLTFCAHRPATARSGPPGFLGLSRFVRAFQGLADDDRVPRTGREPPENRGPPSQPYDVDAAFMSLSGGLHYLRERPAWQGHDAGHWTGLRLVLLILAMQ
jgi:hypothetical protein